jgi:hypothetical protein
VEYNFAYCFKSDGNLSHKEPALCCFLCPAINVQFCLDRRPKKGSACLFFPAAGGIPQTPFDIRTLHAGEMITKDASDDKWIAQMWLREGTYTPTAPPGNSHLQASDAIRDFCSKVV